MCLIAVAWQLDARWPLALIANRDEAHERPSAPASPHPKHPHVYGGRDLRAGGSWLLVSARGRLAAVTNVRDGRHPEPAAQSRGALVADFVHEAGSARAFAARLSAHAGDYGRFNLLLWDGDDLIFASNHPRFSTHAVAPGMHAMSNGAFDAPWPKATHATAALSAWLAGASAAIDSAAPLAPLFDALADTAPAPDALLPDTGVGIALERVLSSPFVRGDFYGTRCSSVVLVEAGRIVFAERGFGPAGIATGASFATLQRTPAA